MHAKRTVVILAGLALTVAAADAHDSWINKGGYRNAAGQ